MRGCTKSEMSLGCPLNVVDPSQPENAGATRHHAHEVSPLEVNRSVSAQPYGSSYFSPGKLAGKTATFLLDTGYTTNLLSWRFFDTLNAGDRANLEPYEGEHGMLADGSCILFYEVIRLTGRVRDQVIRETNIVNQLKEDAILEMPLLKRHKYHIDFSKSAVMMAGRELACVDRFGRPLVEGAGGTGLYHSWVHPGYSSLQSKL